MTDVLGGYTKLMLLIEDGDIDGVDDLLNQGVDINAQNKGGQTALVIAARNGATEIVAKLLEHGADIGITNKVGQTALFTACSQNFEAIVKLMIEYGADINIKDSRGWTPLMIACYHDHINIVRILLQSGADIIAEDSFGKTALNRTRSPEIFQELAVYAQKELENYMQTDISNEKELELQDIRPSSTIRATQKNLGLAFDLDSIRSPNGFHTTKSKFSEKEKSPLNTTASKKIRKLLEFEPKRGDISNHPATMLLRKKKHEFFNQKFEKVQSCQSTKTTRESAPFKPPKSSPYQRTEETETNQSLKIVTTSNFEEECVSKVESQLKSTKKYLTNARSPSQGSTKQKNQRLSYSNQSASRGPRMSVNPNTNQRMPNRNSMKENMPQNYCGKTPTAIQTNSNFKDAGKEDITFDCIKGLLGVYIEDYSKLINSYLRQKVANSLAIQIRRNLATMRQELATGMLQSVLIFHKDLIESLRKVSESFEANHINNSLTDLNEKMTHVIEDFENRMLSNTEDQDVLDLLYQRSQEIDSLGEMQEKYFQYEEGARDEAERSFIAFLKQETSSQMSNVYLTLNDIFQNENSNTEPLYKALVQENVRDLFGQFSTCLKESLDQCSFQEGFRKEKQLTEDSESFAKNGHQQTHETDFEGQELPLQSLDTNVSYLKDSDKEISGDLSKLSHMNTCSNVNPTEIKNYHEKFENYSLNHYSIQRPNNPILIMSLSQASCQQTQTTPRLHETSPSVDDRIPNENIDLKEDAVIGNIEQISRTVDYAISRKNSTSNKKNSSLRKKPHYFQNLLLFEDQGFNNHYSKLRSIDRRSLVDASEPRSSTREMDYEQVKQKEIASTELGVEVSEYLPLENNTNTPVKENSNVVRELAYQFGSLELNKPDYKESCELTATEGTVNESRDGPLKCPYELETEAAKEENHQEVCAFEKEEEPEQLAIREEEQKDDEKIAYIMETAVSDEDKPCVAADETYSHCPGSYSLTEPESKSAIPVFHKEFHHTEGDLVADNKADFIEQSLKTSQSRNPLQTPDLPRPTASSQVKMKKIIHSGRQSVTSVKLDEELQLFENKLLESRGLENSPSLSRSIVIETTKTNRSLGKSNPGSSQKLGYLLSRDTSAVTLPSEENSKRNALTQSLIVECRNLSLDVNRAIAKSNKMHLDYLLNKENFPRKPKSGFSLGLSDSIQKF